MGFFFFTLKLDFGGGKPLSWVSVIGAKAVWLFISLFLNFNEGFSYILKWLFNEVWGYFLLYRASSTSLSPDPWGCLCICLPRWGLRWCWMRCITQSCVSLWGTRQNSLPKPVQWISCLLNVLSQADRHCQARLCWCRTSSWAPNHTDGYMSWFSLSPPRLGCFKFLWE